MVPTFIILYSLSTIYTSRLLINSQIVDAPLYFRLKNITRADTGGKWGQLPHHRSQKKLEFFKTHKLPPPVLDLCIHL